MPVRRRGRYWYMGGKKYRTKKAADRAYKAYRAKKHGKRKRK